MANLKVNMSMTKNEMPGSSPLPGLQKQPLPYRMPGQRKDPPFPRKGS